MTDGVSSISTRFKQFNVKLFVLVNVELWNPDVLVKSNNCEVFDSLLSFELDFLIFFSLSFFCTSDFFDLGTAAVIVLARKCWLLLVVRCIVSSSELQLQFSLKTLIKRKEDWTCA